VPPCLVWKIIFVNGGWFCFIYLEQHLEKCSMLRQLLRIALYGHQDWWCEPDFLIGVQVSIAKAGGTAGYTDVTRINECFIFPYSTRLPRTETFQGFFW
jgi:hypothetical protein